MITLILLQLMRKETLILGLCNILVYIVSYTTEWGLQEPPYCNHIVYSHCLLQNSWLDSCIVHITICSPYCIIIVSFNIRWKRLCKSKDMERIISTNKYRVVIHFHSDVVKSGKGLIANITWRECE